MNKRLYGSGLHRHVDPERIAALRPRIQRVFKVFAAGL
jgi:hypothetical protein